MGGLLSYNKGQREPTQEGVTQEIHECCWSKPGKEATQLTLVCVKLQGGEELTGVAREREGEGACES